MTEGMARASAGARVLGHHVGGLISPGLNGARTEGQGEGGGGDRGKGAWAGTGGGECMHIQQIPLAGMNGEWGSPGH